MLTLAAQYLVVAVSLPLVVLLVREAVRGRRVIANLATAALLVAGSANAVPYVYDDEALGAIARAIGLTAAALLLATYPDGRFTPRWTLIVVLLAAVVQFGNAIAGGSWEAAPWWPWPTLAVWVVLLLGGQLYRFVRRSSVEEHRRTAWPVLALLAQMIAFGVGTSLETGIVGAIGVLDATTALSWLFNMLLPLGFAVGLLAPGLFRVDRALRATIAFGIVAFGLLAVFATLTGVLPAAGLGTDAVLWISGVAVGVLGWPLGRAAGWLADRIVYRGRPDPLRTLEALGEQLERAVDPLEVPRTVVRLVRDALSLARVELRGADGVQAVADEETGTDASKSAAAERAATRAASESFPITYQGEHLADIEAWPRPGESELSEHDRSVVAHLARQAGPALQSARAYVELVEARARLVHAREEERRHLRRDLHDDLAPTFAGLGLAAAAVREYSLAADERAAEAAGELIAGIAAATRQIREIAYDLRPPVLDERGLVAAVRDRVAGDALPPVTVVAPERRLVLPAAVESAALRIVQEAVVNVRRHAAASRCTVSIERREHALAVEIADDGRGMPPVPRDGIGLRSMRERAAELGGGLEIERLAPGTRVFVLLPLPTEAER